LFWAVSITRWKPFFFVSPSFTLARGFQRGFHHWPPLVHRLLQKFGRRILPTPALGRNPGPPPISENLFLVRTGFPGVPRLLLGGGPLCRESEAPPCPPPKKKVLPSPSQLDVSKPAEPPRWLFPHRPVGKTGVARPRRPRPVFGIDELPTYVPVPSLIPTHLVFFSGMGDGDRCPS